jgi:pimeloyl-ACP methyl ester carboxylesterase
VRVVEHTIELEGAPVFYRSASSPGIPVLYLHGIPTSSDDWMGLLERTGGIAPDLPGFGRTSKAGHLDYSLKGHADFLERFLVEIGTTRVKLVAHDWGAGGGLTFAQRHPDAIERIVLIDALPLLDGFHWHRLARNLRRPGVGELLMGALTRRQLARLLRRGSVHPDTTWPEDAVARVWEQFDQGTQRAILRLHRSSDERTLAAAGEALPTLTAPALVVWGDRDPWLEARFAHAYATRLPNAEPARIADAGHWPWRDAHAVADRIVEFHDAP